MTKQRGSIEEESRFVASVRTGLKQLDSGERVPHVDVEREVEAWLVEMESFEEDRVFKLVAEKS